MERGDEFDGRYGAWDIDEWSEGVDGEFYEGGAVHGDERTCRASGGGGWGDVHDAEGSLLAAGDEPYDRCDESSVWGEWDAVCVSGLERSRWAEPYGDGVSDGLDIHGDVWGSACGDGFGESFRGWDVDVGSCGGRG
jgi:hypothetical protein